MRRALTKRGVLARSSAVRPATGWKAAVTTTDMVLLRMRGLYSTFGELFTAFDTITAARERSERAGLFAGTARRFYRMA
jgi:predicted TIM-barrel fold metal-dependent hydrolase